MICITGIPGTGKTTICKMLNGHGIQCASLNDIARECGAIDGDTVDIDILRRGYINSMVVESHYSHMLECEYAIILEDDENRLTERMNARGYSGSKIAENIDAQRSGIIYWETVDRLPANHIFVIQENSRNIEEVFAEVMNIILSLHNKVN